METTSQRIRRLRKEAFGETYREADKASGISASSWANWETKGTEPYGRSLRRLAEVLTQGLGRPVTTHEILTGQVGAAAQEAHREAIVDQLDQGIAVARRHTTGGRRSNGERRQGR